MRRPNTMLGRPWRRLRHQAILRDRGQCVKCGSLERLEVDHILAVSLGGANNIENLQTLCRACHAGKSARDKARKRWRDAGLPTIRRDGLLTSVRGRQ